VGILQVPEYYEEHLIRFIHHATGTLEDVASSALREFSDTFVPGEEVAARVDDRERPCRVLSVTAAAPQNGETLVRLVDQLDKSALHSRLSYYSAPGMAWD
jgi:hypothetical protein